MTLKRFDLLVRDARDQSANQRYSTTQGVPQREFVRYGNSAQDRIYNLIMQAHPSIFCKESFIDAVANQARYTLPTDVFIQHNVVKVDYSHNGNAINYFPLKLRTPRQEVSAPGYPESYFLRDGSMIVSPYPTSSITNGFRLNYQYIIPALDIRRGSIASFVGTAPTLTSFVITDDTVFTQENRDELSNGYVDYVSIVTKDGVITAKNIPVVSYNATTRTVTCNHTMAAGEVVANGSYVVYGANATTHSSLPPVCERYITTYMALSAQARDSNVVDVSTTSPILQAIEKEILDSVADLEEDITAVSILDRDFLNYTEEWDDGY